VLADLIELGPGLAPILRAARLARTRHHQMLVIVPWPADVPPPEDDPAPKAEPVWPTGDDRARRRKKRRRSGDRGGSLMSVVQTSLTRQYHESFRKLRRALGQAGAAVVRVNEGDPIRLVLDRLDRLRGIRTHR
jgi:hypothetical protein